MKKARRLRKVLLGLAGFRAALGIAAIPLAPLLYDDHFLILVLMRPTKEVLIAAGFQARRGQVPLWQIAAAALPLSVLGVWHFFYLGKAYSAEIKNGDVPGIGSRLLPAKRIDQIRKVLDKKGDRIVFIGRLAAFPSALVGAAAGGSNMPSAKFLRLDGAGAVLALVEVLAAGYLLGQAYERLGRGQSKCKGLSCLTDSQFWVSPRVAVTIAGVGALAVLLTLMGRYLKKV